MDKGNLKNRRLGALFLLGAVLLNYPILSLFNQPVPLFSLPRLYAYIFCAWGALIILMALATRSRSSPPLPVSPRWDDPC